MLPLALLLLLQAPFEVHEASIDHLQSALTGGRVTAVQLVDLYFARIAAYDQAGPRLNAVIRLNPRAREDAARMDAERRAGRVRGPLHGVPVLLKDNFETTGWATAGSSVALAGWVSDRDAFQVRRLRDAGAVILGKTNMHELAAGITTISSLGGQTRNPYDPMRNPGGSSGGSGAAVAASFAALAWGSDTCGSIRIPASVHNLYGLRPTSGLSSIAGIIPLSHTQDTGGPLARTVRDLAIALDATVGYDRSDPATHILRDRAPPAFLAALDTAALRGKRLGVLVPHLGDQPDDQEVTRIVRAALDKMKAQGAEVVDVKETRFDSLAQRAGVISHEFKFDLLEFLAARANAPVKSLSEIIERGLYHVALEETFRARDTVKVRDSGAYRAALARRDSTRAAVLRLMDEQRLDALVYPTLRRRPAVIGEPQRGANCQLSAVTGLPALSLPAGFTPDGLPVGMELLGRSLSDTALVAMAYDYEQAVRPRRPPSQTPPLTAAAPVSWQINRSADGGLALDARFTYDPLTRSLSYGLEVTGVAPDDVHAITLNRTGPAGATLVRLSGPGRAKAAGELALSEPQRAALLNDEMMLVVYTRATPHGALRARFASLR